MKKNIKIKIYALLTCLIVILPLTVYGEKAIVIPVVSLKSKHTMFQKQDDYISTTRFSKTDITNSPVVNLSQFLKQEQSVVRLTNSSGDASQTALSIRGFGDNASANSLILIDGFPLINPSLLAPNFNSIPLTDIERIEIFQGSQGSLWGDQAVGGVVNIVTKHPKKFFTNGIFSVGSYNSYFDHILIGDKANNGFFYKIFGLIGRTLHYRQHNQQHSNNVAGQIGLDYSRGIISFNVQTYGDTINFPGGLSEAQFKHNPRQATESKNFSRYRTNLFQILNKHELNENWILETRISHHVTNGDGVVFFSFNRSDGLTTINPRLVGNIRGNKLIIGYNGQFSRYQLINIKVQSRTSANQNSFYFQATHPITNKIDFILGARKAWQANKIEAKIGQPTHSLDQAFVTEQGLSYRPTQMLSLFIRRDGNVSFPKADEETWLPRTINSLQAQTGTSYETGLEWKTQKSRSAISLYRLELNNEIAFNPTQSIDQPFGFYINLDKTLRHGISLSQDYNLTSRASVKGQINYVDARFVSGLFAGNLVPAVPNFTGNVTFDYNWTDRWATQYILLYTGSRYASKNIQNIGNKLPGYWLSDIAIQYFMKSFIFSVEVHNLFNKHYPNYVFFNEKMKSNIFYPAAGINYLFTLKINL